MLEKVVLANRGLTALERSLLSASPTASTPSLPLSHQPQAQPLPQTQSQSLPVALASADLLSASQSLLRSMVSSSSTSSSAVLSSSQDIIRQIRRHEATKAKEEFLQDDNIRYALQNNEQKLLIPNQGFHSLPAEVGETLFLQTAYVKELHCARNKLRGLLSTEMPQLSAYHFRYARMVDLSYNQLNRLPDCIGCWKELERLDLSHNELSKIPASFLSLRQLHTLILEANSFDHLPEELGNLDGLTSLDLSSNLFPSFPFPVTKLRGLKTLKLAHNVITSLAILPPLLKAEDMWMPTIDRRTGQALHMNILTKEKVLHIELYDGKGIQKAADLHVYQPAKSRSYRRRKIWLSVCGVQEWEPVVDGITGGTFYRNNVSGDTTLIIPSSLDTIGGMKTLTELVLSRNAIGVLPPSFLALVQLKRLIFTQNRLRDLPEDIGVLKQLEYLELTSNELKILPISLCQCTALKQLLLNDNHLLRLPDDLGRLPNLTLLNVSVNHLKALPSTLGFCEPLKTLSVSENPIEDPPPTEFSKGMDQVKWYLRNRYHIQQRGMPPMMTYHHISINEEITLLQPEVMEAVMQKIVAAKKDGVLNLQLLGLKEIPAPVLKMQHLKKLKLDFNKSLDLQNGFPVELAPLQALSIRGCGLTVFPGDNLHMFEKLTTLTLEENRLEYLPAGFCQLRALTSLDLSKNRLYSLPDNFHELSSLMTLTVESNNLEALPATFYQLTELKTLNLAKNRLVDLPVSLCWLQSLTVLNLEKNMLYFLPEEMKHMHLMELRVGHNRLESLSPTLFEEELGRTLHMFSCCENNLLELPRSLVHLSKQTFIEADYNSFISPPPQLLREGIVVVQHYMTIREQRKELLTELLEDEDFAVNRDCLQPSAIEVLEDGTGFLTPEDLAEFDIAVHEFLNGEYYKCPATAEEIVASVTQLREDRETELYLVVIRAFLGVMHDIEESRDIRFWNDATILMQQRPWGRDGEASNVYAISLSALLRETPPNTIYPDGRPSIFSLIARKMPHISFPFTIDLLKDSIRLYVSPYGIIADTEQVLFPQCDCVDPAFGNRPKRHEACTKAAVVLIKSVYVEEEADRREQEEDEFMERFDEIDFNIRIWLLTEEGQKALNQEIRARKNVLKEEISLREEMLLTQQFKIRKAKDVLTDLLNRKDLFEAGQAYEHHGFQDIQEAIRKISKAEEEVNVLTERIDILMEMLKKLKTSLSQDRSTFNYQAALDLVQKYCVLGYNAAVLEFRRFASANNLNRHWDGEDGSAYLEWKSKHMIMSSHVSNATSEMRSGSRDKSERTSRPGSAPGGLERSYSASSVNSASSADTHTSRGSRGTTVSVKNTALETEFDWKDTNHMEKFQLKLYDRYRSNNPFAFASS
eukprot:scaffold1524_cov182-Ochromonas_danica.AAC.4